MKIEGMQTIPGEWEDEYKAALSLKNENDVVQKRYPFKMPDFQEGGKRVTPAQIVQRERFKLAFLDFANVDDATRTRWYNASPEWHSYLWYYNYFIMSSLAGNANADGGGLGVIKSIQVVKESVPTTGTKSFTIAEVDPAKTVVMLYGNSYISDTVQRFSGVAADNTEVTKSLSPNVELAIAEVKVFGDAGRMDIGEGSGTGDWASWYCSYLSASQVKIKLRNIESPDTHGYYIEVIEHKAQTIYPVLVSIAAEAVVIDWANTPSVAADVSIIVIEYI